MLKFASFFMTNFTFLQVIKCKYIHFAEITCKKVKLVMKKDANFSMNLLN